MLLVGLESGSTVGFTGSASLWRSKLELGWDRKSGLVLPLLFIEPGVFMATIQFTLFFYLKQKVETKIIFRTVAKSRKTINLPHRVSLKNTGSLSDVNDIRLISLNKDSSKGNLFNPD